MKDTRAVFIAFLLAGCCVCAGTNIAPSVTVIYSQPTDNGTMSVTKVIPWEDGLEVRKAIAMAGGYSNPPHWGISIIRGDDITVVSLTSPSEGMAPIYLNPGDRIEIK